MAEKENLKDKLLSHVSGNPQTMPALTHPEVDTQGKEITSQYKILPVYFRLQAVGAELEPVTLQQLGELSSQHHPQTANETGGLLSILVGLMYENVNLAEYTVAMLQLLQLADQHPGLFIHHLHANSHTSPPSGAIATFVQIGRRIAERPNLSPIIMADTDFVGWCMMNAVLRMREPRLSQLRVVRAETLQAAVTLARNSDSVRQNKNLSPKQ